jgi:hypothetical protein
MSVWTRLKGEYDSANVFKSQNITPERRASAGLGGSAGCLDATRVPGQGRPKVGAWSSTRHLRGHPKKGLSVSAAGQRYCALTSPDLYRTLTVGFAWTADQDRKWLSELLEGELLGFTASV